MNGPETESRRTERPAETLVAGHHTDSYVDCSGRAGRVRRRPIGPRRLNLRYIHRRRCCNVSSCVHMVVVPERLRRWFCRCRAALQLLAVSVLLTLLRCPSLLDRIVPVLLAYVLMPPVAAANDRRCAVARANAAIGVGGGSRVRDTKKALLDRSNAGTTASGAGICSRPSRSSQFVAKGTVSKITEKFQTQPVPPARTTRIPKLLQHWSLSSPPPLPPPAVVKYEIKKRQDKLLSEIHRHRNRWSDDRTSFFSCGGPLIGPGSRDSAASSDCGSCSSDSEKSVAEICCSGGPVEDPAVTAVDEKPGSPHSSGYESVEETAITAELAQTPPLVPVPYSWVFGASEHDGTDGFADYAVVSSSSSDNSMIAAVAVTAASEDRLERLVTFASTASFPALTSAKPEQDDRSNDDDAPAAGRRHFVRNAVATPIAVPAGCLSPIPEYSSTEPNSVETVEHCSVDDDDDNKVPTRPTEIR